MTLPHVFATDLAPHFNAIIVGFFTLGGVYLSTRHDRSLRRKEFVVHALERIYGHALDAKAAVNRAYEALLERWRSSAAGLPETPIPAQVFEEVSRMVGIYAPKIRRHAEAARESLTHLNAAWERACNAGAEPTAHVQPQEALHRFNAAIQQLLDAIRRELTARL